MSPPTRTVPPLHEHLRARPRVDETAGLVATATQFFEFIRSIAGFSIKDGSVHLPPVRFQPMAAADVASAIADLALAAPVHGTVEIAGPESFTLDEAVRKVLDFDHDERSVIADPAAPYFGVQVNERTLVPGDGARLGSTTLEWWLSHVPAPGKVTRNAPALERAQ
jgi:uncharacterized protein YbjT (DUF2867 family)